MVQYISCSAQGIEGISLACTFMDAGYSRIKYALFALAFVLITPIGIGAAAAPLQRVKPAARGLGKQQQAALLSMSLSCLQAACS
jgi:zinc transporter ZupT